MLNKNGWGLTTLIIFISIFTICLIFSAFLITRSVKKLNDANTRDNVNVVDTEDVNNFYTGLETSVIDAAKEYSRENPSILDKEEFVLKVSSLIESGYLNSLDDESGNMCSGYVIIENISDTTYTSYIKCDEYETNGYEVSKDL